MTEKTVRYDLSPLETESELRAKMIDLGWTPPTALPGDKADPCILKRKPGEPMFTLLGRDPFAMSLVRLWATAREVFTGKVTAPDRLAEARSISVNMGRWYCVNTGANKIPDVLDHLPVDVLAAALTRRGYRSGYLVNPSAIDGEQQPEHPVIIEMSMRNFASASGQHPLHDAIAGMNADQAVSHLTGIPRGSLGEAIEEAIAATPDLGDAPKEVRTPGVAWPFQDRASDHEKPEGTPGMERQGSSLRPAHEERG